MSEPNGVRVTKAEFVVLDRYARNEAAGKYDTMPIMAKECRMSRSAFDKVIEILRTRGWVSGTRKVILTQEGAENHKKIATFIADQQRAKQEAGSADPSAAAVAGAPQRGDPHPQQAERYDAPRAPQPPAEIVRARRVDKQPTLSESLAERLRVKPEDVFEVIKNNVISVGKGEHATNAEVLQVMSVMLKYDLDPFVKQVHAFRHKGKLQIAVGVDGWTAIANRRDTFEGVEYEFPDEMTETPDGKMCWPWVKAVCYVTGRVPTVKYAFLDEWYVPTKKGDYSPSNWATYPRHRLQQKAYQLAVKEAFGISLYDTSDVEQLRFVDADAVVMDAMTEKQEKMKQLLKAPEPVPENEDEYADIEDITLEEGEEDGSD